MKLIYLAKRYDLVIGDQFELFYRGVISSMNPYKYYIYVYCEKGNSYPRVFRYTPKDGEEGDYELTLTLYNDYHEEIETAKTILHVVKPCAPERKLNVLCFGDSLTFNGVWPYEGYRRFTHEDGEPKGLGFKDSLNFIGKCKKEEIGYEGYGGWQWRHFDLNEAVSPQSSVWVNVKEHHFDENDQHSVFSSDGLLWILESITPKRLKFKRGSNNFSCLPTINNHFIHVEGGIHQEDFDIESYEFEQSNPFYDEEIKGPNFSKYALSQGVETIDYIYILLTWNGQYRAYNDDFSHYEPHINSILRRIHKDFPNCKVGLIGIQSPSVTGGISANYGCHGYYHDVFGEVVSAYNYSVYLENLAYRDEYKDYVRYIDMKAQFDVEYNMPHASFKVNNRSNITEELGTNGVHPTMEGYLQIGDVFYRALVSDIEERMKGK